ncbi:MAG: hypothetical protein JSS66_00185 [Armatimonadetes bacterium]|nr:hypothetical protein [Armatimonadota bacterium]
MNRTLTASGAIDYQEWRIEDSGASVMVRISRPESMVYQLTNSGPDPLAPLRLMGEAHRLAVEAGASILIVASEELDSPTKTRWLIRAGFKPQMIVMTKEIAGDQ